MIGPAIGFSPFCSISCTDSITAPTPGRGAGFGASTALGACATRRGLGFATEVGAGMVTACSIGFCTSGAITGSLEPLECGSTPVRAAMPIAENTVSEIAATVNRG